MNHYFRHPYKYNVVCCLFQNLPTCVYISVMYVVKLGKVVRFLVIGGDVFSNQLCYNHLTSRCDTLQVGVIMLNGPTVSNYSNEPCDRRLICNYFIKFDYQSVPDAQHSCLTSVLSGLISVISHVALTGSAVSLVYKCRLRLHNIIEVLHISLPECQLRPTTLARGENFPGRLI